MPVRAAAAEPGPVYLRFTRDAMPVLYEEGTKFEIGKAVQLRDGGDVAILANGDTVHLALTAAQTLAGQGIEARVLDMHTVKPLDAEAVRRCAEEIGRIYGYYNIEPTLMKGDTFRGRLSPETAFEDEVKDMCVTMGCYEMYNYNFTGPAALNALRIPEGDEKRLAVKLLNPFGEDQSLMRTTLMAGMLDTLARNCNRKTGCGRFFEVGNVHFDNNADLPEERKMLGIIVSGSAESFFTLKGCLEFILRRLGIEERAEFVTGGGEYFQPGQKATVLVNGEVIGEMGTIHPDVRKAFSVPQAAYAAELNMKKLFDRRVEKKTYKALPKYPLVPRDIAVVVDENVTSAEVVKVIQQSPVKVILENVELFDVYRGPGIPEGKKSMAYSYTVRAEDRTLTDEDISGAMNAIVRSLKARLNADLRA